RKWEKCYEENGFFSNLLVGGALAVANSGFLIVTAKRDENEMLEKFGDEYADYMAKTKLFIPFLF
ncbi:MAG: methyltransferase family protein, partial [Nitrospinota bacterium]